jgi:hypothetical protein
LLAAFVVSVDARLAGNAGTALETTRMAAVSLAGVS